jgi:hypothetical protein
MPKELKATASVRLSKWLPKANDKRTENILKLLGMNEK